MDIKLVNPFIESVATIMPQMGFQKITRGKMGMGQRSLKSLGVTALVGFSNSICGNVAYNMTNVAACHIASTMMMGMPIVQLDEMAASAISELANMLSANVATNLSSEQYPVDISIPSLTIGEDFFIDISEDQYLIIEMNVDGTILEVNIKIA
jgi:chemotaxis protein CheX